MKHAELVEQMSIVATRISKREAMLSRLYCLGAQFPDEDLQQRYEAIKAEAERRNKIDAEDYDWLEMRLELLNKAVSA